ncbi:hypothetical protein BD780_000866 [Clostridium tetanomorphum]|uniref:Uncharacterized protein n=1 Tax=Clostridium tetanomorphum TaxID=1553 RepID=A0A923J1H4_CLOTT|nr:hypothetical protein [Clostridium tetanomorphum]KAJ48738.1 hypothetical protein CTM_26775 [Clostridium tetanomorphum DSM 665]KAJ53112.1 hypothetical protein CTM_04240 [Clostridium tetanomorphum DSM 665]MBC2398799.1 hypothetical protein [Clostridium tetanomorphum]MBP1863542.1 hypothetical protein [Clostridium tetanomorphum]NRS83641.1 hypothetical protein [Clostridium tetanomorphum]
MNCVWVGFDREFNTELICNVTKEKFKLRECYCYTINSIKEVLDRFESNSLVNSDDIAFYQVIRNESEFPLVLEFFRLKDVFTEMPTDIYLGYELSIALGCKTIVDGTGFGDDASPYWDIVFDKGCPYLADDLESKFCDEGGKKIQIIRQMELQELKRIRGQL